MKTIVLATKNKHKAQEISEMLNHQYQVQTMEDVGFYSDIQEDGSNFKENAEIKAHALYQYLKGQDLIIMGDDSGLAVDSLNGEPGVYSARYAGEPSDDLRNNEKLLKSLKGFSKDERTAHFICALAIIDGKTGNNFLVEGCVTGFIGENPMGDGGFGYDPLFMITETQSFAQLSPDEKNRISHRGEAIQKAKKILKEL